MLLSIIITVVVELFVRTVECSLLARNRYKGLSKLKILEIDIGEYWKPLPEPTTESHPQKSRQFEKFVTIVFERILPEFTDALINIFGFF